MCTHKHCEHVVNMLQTCIVTIVCRHLTLVWALRLLEGWRHDAAMWLDGCTYAWLDALDALDASCGAVAPYAPSISSTLSKLECVVPRTWEIYMVSEDLDRFRKIRTAIYAISYDQLIANCNDFAWQVGEVYWRSFWLPFYLRAVQPKEIRSESIL